MPSLFPRAFSQSIDAVRAFPVKQFGKFIPY
jgi:hypothetical protein